jgi:hypothetical protein
VTVVNYGWSVSFPVQAGDTYSMVLAVNSRATSAPVRLSVEIR